MRILFIKNIVCKKCISTIREEFEKIGVEIEPISLGRIRINFVDKKVPIRQIRDILEKKGFELLSDKEAKLIEQSKIYIENLIHNTKINLSNHSEIKTALEKKFNVDYKYLSCLFASFESMSIDYFIYQQKIVKTKELLKYEGLTLSDISFKLGFRNVKILSNHFKTMTGFTPNQFKILTKNMRMPRNSEN